MISISEVINEIDNKNLNIKNNNYIFYGFDSSFLYAVVNYSRGRVAIIENYDEIKFERDVVSNTLQNICIDLSEENIEELFNKILKQIGVNEKLPFKDAIDVYKFKNLLYKNKKMIQLILYNCEYIKKEKQCLLNEMLKINTYLFNIIYLLKGDTNLSTYYATNNYVLDDREDYLKLKVRID